MVREMSQSDPGGFLFDQVRARVMTHTLFPKFWANSCVAVQSHLGSCRHWTQYVRDEADLLILSTFSLPSWLQLQNVFMESVFLSTLPAFLVGGRGEVQDARCSVML
jgi:hypothetical protein